MNSEIGCGNTDRVFASRVRFMVGRNQQGRWVVEDRLGQRGGLFISQSAAVHFALDEADRDQALVHIVPGEAVLSIF